MQLGYTPEDVSLLAQVRTDILARADCYRDAETFLRTRYGPDQLHQEAMAEWQADQHRMRVYAEEAIAPDYEPDEIDRVERRLAATHSPPPVPERWTPAACAAYAIQDLLASAGSTHNDTRAQAVLIVAVLLWDEDAHKRHDVFTMFGNWGFTPAGKLESASRNAAAYFLYGENFLSEEKKLRPWMDMVGIAWTNLPRSAFPWPEPARLTSRCNMQDDNNPDPHKVISAADEFRTSDYNDNRCQSLLEKCRNNPQRIDRQARLMVRQSQYYGRKKSAAGVLVDAAVAWGFDANVFSDYIAYPTEKHSDKLMVELHRLRQRADLDSYRPRQQTPPQPTDAENPPAEWKPATAKATSATLSTSEAATLLSIDQAHVRRLCGDEKLKAVKDRVGDEWVIERSSVDDYRRQHPTRRKPTPTPTLKSLPTPKPPTMYTYECVTCHVEVQAANCPTGRCDNCGVTRWTRETPSPVPPK
jgi:excisionase family DNA binding protein